VSGFKVTINDEYKFTLRPGFAGSIASLVGGSFVVPRGATYKIEALNVTLEIQEVIV
jgi:hypothetical protein